MINLDKLNLDSELKNKMISYLYDKRIILNDEEERIINNIYYAINVIIGKYSIIKIINEYGGYIKVISSNRLIDKISNIFNVPSEIIIIRLLTIFKEFKRNEQIENSIIVLRKLNVNIYDILNYVIDLSKYERQLSLKMNTN